MTARNFINNNQRIRIAIGILILFHTIGIGIMLWSDQGSSLSYLNLLLCGIILFLSDGNYGKAIASFLFIAVGGFAIEYIGIHTGILFGEYNYGESLGPKLFGIPIIIGINWYCIVLASCALISKVKLPIVIKSLVAGILCTGMDYIIEPVAIKLDFWSWDGGIIPVWNYGCWFIFSFVFALFYFSLKPKLNRPAQSLFLIWLIFFTILTLAL